MATGESSRANASEHHTSEMLYTPRVELTL